MANPKRFTDAKALKAAVNKPNTWPTALTPPAPADIDTLPDVVGDDQINVVTAEYQRNGLPITLRQWPNAAESPCLLLSLAQPRCGRSLCRSTTRPWPLVGLSLFLARSGRTTPGSAGPAQPGAQPPGLCLST